MKVNLKAQGALLIANIIYGLNFVIAKGIMPDYMAPRAIIFLRISGALIVFSLIHLFFVKERIDKKDVLRLALCGLFGIAINQILFFEGLNLSTPINASIIMTCSPILVLIYSFFLLKEKITSLKIIGISLGTIGASIIILSSGEFSFSSATFTGNILIILNAASYSLYLVVVKPLMNKYSPLTIMKWVFTFGFMWSFPFCIGPISKTDFSAIPPNIWLSIFYVIIGTTIFAYLLLNYALKFVSPVVNSSYIYSQPVIVSLVAVLYMNETLTLIESASAVLIFIGVYFVSVRKEKLLRSA